MLALGIILILLAAGMVYVAFAGATDQTAIFDLGVFNLEMNTQGVFVAGGVTVLVLVLGLALLRAGVRSANRRRKEKKELKRLHALDERSTRTTAGSPDGTSRADRPTTSHTTTQPESGTPSTTQPGQGSTPTTQPGTGDRTHRDGTVTDR